MTPGRISKGRAQIPPISTALADGPAKSEVIARQREVGKPRRGFHRHFNAKPQLVGKLSIPLRLHRRNPRRGFLTAALARSSTIAPATWNLGVEPAARAVPLRTRIRIHRVIDPRYR